MDFFLQIILPLAGICGLTWAVKKIIPDNPLTGSGCGGG